MHRGIFITVSMICHSLNLVTPLRVIVINDPTNILRRHFIKRQLQSHGLHASFFQAYNKSYQPSLTENAKLIAGVRRNQIAFIAHMEVLRNVSASGQVTLVLEDDALPVSNVSTRLVEYMHQLPSGWGYLDISACCNFHGGKQVSQNMYSRQDMGRTRGLVAYVITPRCAADVVKAYDFETRIKYLVDRWMSDSLSVCNVYWAEPMLFEHGNSNRN